jgi:DNA-binding MarR family transcriptional regulator
MKRTLSKRKRAALEVMSKPKTPAEIRDQIGLKRNSNLSSTIRELIRLNLICCLNPNAKVGKLYGLTSKGQKLKKKLLTEKGMPYSYSEPSQINWRLYGWVVCGRQKNAILKAMKMPMPLKYIKEMAQEYNPRISRTNANDILQLFVKKGLAEKTRQYNRIIFALTKHGQTIRAQLLEP